MSNLPISLRSILITGFGALLALLLCILLVLWAWRADDIATVALALALLGFGMMLGAWMIRRVLDHETAWGLAADQAEATWRAMGDGVIRVRADGCIDAMNAVAERYTGWTAAEARGQPLDTVYRLVEDQTGLPLLHKENAARGSRALVMQLLHRDGTLCAVRDSMARLPSAIAAATTTRAADAAAADGWVVVFHDVTEIEQMAPHAVLVQAQAYPGGGLYYTLDLDYPRILDIFRRHGYRGALSLEMEGNAHPDQGVPEALAMLRAALAH